MKRAVALLVLMSLVAAGAVASGPVDFNAKRYSLRVRDSIYSQDSAAALLGTPNSPMRSIWVDSVYFYMGGTWYPVDQTQPTQGQALVFDTVGVDRWKAGTVSSGSGSYDSTFAISPLSVVQSDQDTVKLGYDSTLTLNGANLTVPALDSIGGTAGAALFADSAGKIDTAYGPFQSYVSNNEAVSYDSTFAVTPLSVVQSAQDTVKLGYDSTLALNGSSLTVPALDSIGGKAGLADSALKIDTTYGPFQTYVSNHSGGSGSYDSVFSVAPLSVVQSDQDTVKLAYDSTLALNGSSLTVPALDSIGGVAAVADSALKIDTTYGPFQTYVSNHSSGSGSYDSVFAVSPLSVVQSDQDTVKLGYDSTLALNGSSLTVTALDSIGGKAGLADSALKIDTTYTPFQTYVANHAVSGSGTEDTTVFWSDTSGSVSTRNNRVDWVPGNGLDVEVLATSPDTVLVTVDGTELDVLGDTSVDAAVAIVYPDTMRSEDSGAALSGTSAFPWKALYALKYYGLDTTTGGTPGFYSLTPGARGTAGQALIYGGGDTTYWGSVAGAFDSGAIMQVIRDTTYADSALTAAIARDSATGSATKGMGIFDSLFLISGSDTLKGLPSGWYGTQTVATIVADTYLWIDTSATPDDTAKLYRDGTLDTLVFKNFAGATIVLGRGTGGGTVDSTFAVTPLSVVQSDQDTVKINYDSTLALNGSSLTVPALDSIGGKAALADSALKIDTTYTPFQTYVANHGGAGSYDSTFAVTPLSVVQSDQDTVKINYDSTLALNGSSLTVPALDSIGGKAGLADSALKIDTTYGPFQTYVSNHQGSGSYDSTFAVTPLSVVQSDQDTVKISYDSTLALNGSSLTVPALDSIGGVAAVADSALKIDTTYSPFQTYVSNHASGSGSYDTTFALVPLTVVHSDHDTLGLAYDSTLTVNGSNELSVIALTQLVSSSGSIYSVAPAGMPYTSVQTAVTAASAGDVVLVYPGTYTDSVSLKDSVTIYLLKGAVLKAVTDDSVALYAEILGEGKLRGSAGNAVQVTRSATELVLACDSIIATGHAIDLDSGTVTIKDCNLYSGLSTVYSSDGHATLTMYGGSFHAEDDYGMYTAGTDSIKVELYNVVGYAAGTAGSGLGVYASSIYRTFNCDITSQDLQAVEIWNAGRYYDVGSVLRSFGTGGGEGSPILLGASDCKAYLTGSRVEASAPDSQPVFQGAGDGETLWVSRVTVNYDTNDVAWYRVVVLGTWWVDGEAGWRGYVDSATYATTADSALKIDTTYAPFQTYVSNNELVSYDSAFAISPLSVVQSDQDTVKISYDSTLALNGSSLTVPALDSIGGKAGLADSALKIDTTYGPFQSYVSNNELVSYDSTFAVAPLSVVQSAQDTVKISYDSTLALNGSSLTVPALDSIGGVAAVADSALKIDTTYGPFQSYVSNHAGSGTEDTTVFWSDTSGSVSTRGNHVDWVPGNGLDVEVLATTPDTVLVTVDGTELDVLGDTSIDAAPLVIYPDTLRSEDSAAMLFGTPALPTGAGYFDDLYAEDTTSGGTPAFLKVIPDLRGDSGMALVLGGGDTSYWSDTIPVAMRAVADSNGTILYTGYMRVDGNNTMLGDLDMGANQVTNVGWPAADTDAVNRGYADARYINDAANTVADSAIDHPVYYQDNISEWAGFYGATDSVRVSWGFWKGTDSLWAFQITDSMSTANLPCSTYARLVPPPGYTTLDSVYVIWQTSSGDSAVASVNWMVIDTVPAIHSIAYGVHDSLQLTNQGTGTDGADVAMVTSTYDVNVVGIASGEYIRLRFQGQLDQNQWLRVLVRTVWDD